jgi:hypothetical protein
MAEVRVEKRIIPQNTGVGRPASPKRPGNDMLRGPNRPENNVNIPGNESKPRQR